MSCWLVPPSPKPGTTQLPPKQVARTRNKQTFCSRMGRSPRRSAAQALRIATPCVEDSQREAVDLRRRQVAAPERCRCCDAVEGGADGEGTVGVGQLDHRRAVHLV